MSLWQREAILTHQLEARSLRGLSLFLRVQIRWCFMLVLSIVNGIWRAVGGRVLGIAARGDSLDAARALAYETIGHIRWPEGIYRHDIGL